MLYYGARYYDAALRRFISADTIVPSAANPQALNRYSYALNNPLKYTDPTGHAWCDDHVCQGDDDLTGRESQSSAWEKLGVFGEDPTVDEVMQGINSYGVEAFGFSVKQLRVILTVLNDLASAFGSKGKAVGAMGGVQFVITEATLDGTQKAYQAGRTIVLRSWVFNRPGSRPKITIAHELAHYWDWNRGEGLMKIFNLSRPISSGLSRFVGNERKPTKYAREEWFFSIEDWAESMAMYLYPDYKENLNVDGEPGSGLNPFHWTYVYNQFHLP